MLSAQERRRILENIGAPELPASEWSAVESRLKAVRLKKGEFFIKAGEPSKRFAVIRSGLMRFYYIDEKGREATKAFRGAGELVAAYAEMLMQVPSRTFVQALEDTELLAADFAELRRLYDRSPVWQAVGRKVAEYFYVAKERREFELLQLSATERYRRFLADFPGLVGRIPQYHIASYLGITPVALSRIVRGR